MVTHKDIERAQQNREVGGQGSLLETGLTEPAFGPSDSSDSGSDAIGEGPDTDSDRANTGGRAQVENTGDEPLNDDIEADRIVPEDRAGLAHTPPDPERNGGTDDT
ncbi:MatE family transporter [Allopusillimonas ginsengisoli]|uniref:MatE family transporter n=1 Tax=Allopusillimonas ginsengisoli TaxID=453575 RepID=UPI0026B215F2